MISVDTVLILGAGASYSYGLPLGVGLLNDVCGMLEDTNSLNMLVACGHQKADLETFRLSLSLSGFRSVDAFLEENPHFIDIGKTCIAACLIPKEDPRLLFPPRAPNDHWYWDLLEFMSVGSPKFSENRLAVITFNYDRSLEHYLWSVLHTRYRDGRLADLLYENIQIVHVHGSLGKYCPSEDESGRTYSTAWNPQTIRMAKDGILIVSEPDAMFGQFDIARPLLDQALRIYFLGFGYNPKNIQRLGIFSTAWDEARCERQKVNGTATGILQKDLRRIRESFNGAMQNLAPNGVFDFMRGAALD